MLVRLSSLLVLCLFILSCSKKEGLPSDPTLSNEGFKGITQTENDGTLTPKGWVDTDDWKSDTSWDAHYPLPLVNDTLLSSKPNTGHHGPTAYELRPAYPNPTLDTVRFFITKKDTFGRRYVIE